MKGTLHRLIVYRCSWCQSEKEEAADGNVKNQMVSYGLCDECYEKMILQLQRDLAERPGSRAQSTRYKTA